jgi:hypothetical protein
MTCRTRKPPWSAATSCDARARNAQLREALSGGIGFIIAESLMKDRSGRIWIGAADSLGLYDPATGSFRQYRSPDEACGTVAIAHDISEDQDGRPWRCTTTCAHAQIKIPSAPGCRPQPARLREPLRFREIYLALPENCSRRFRGFRTKAATQPKRAPRPANQLHFECRPCPMKRRQGRELQRARPRLEDSLHVCVWNHTFTCDAARTRPWRGPNAWCDPCLEEGA